MQYASLQVLSDREWIMTNGLGGYSLGFGNMINKRKYNGLLIAGASDLKRVHILATLEEKVETENAFFYIDSNHYPNCMYPNGYDHLVRSWLRPYPAALYSSVPHDEDNLIFKEIFLLKDVNAVAVKYTNLGKKTFSMRVRPKFTLRDHHHVNAQGTWNWCGTEKDVHSNYFSFKRLDSGYEAFGYAEDGEIYEEMLVFGSTYYPTEAGRGYDAVEDLISPVRIMLSLQPGKSSYLLFSSEPIAEPKRKAIDAERFYKKYPLPSDHPSNVKTSLILNNAGNRNVVFDKDDYAKILELATEEFIVKNSDIIAGFPWFGAWGRDTLISMSALKYMKNGPELAKKILKKYGSEIKNGMMPNTFGEGGAGLNYDTVDAPLWYVMRAWEFGNNDPELFANSVNIVLNYMYNENNPFFMAGDGLIEIRISEHAMTWMDARIYNNPVTPRHGKPVEINALWFNALNALREMAKSAHVSELRNDGLHCDLKQLDGLIEKVKLSMKKFVGDNFLADRLEGDNPIFEIRPNAVTALSLPFDFADKDVIKKVWKTAKDKLLTLYGLRTLDPAHPAFKQKYIGNQKQRDMAYHQGTTWAYLLLPFANLTAKALKDDRTKEEISKEISGYVWALRDGMMRGELASIAEVWDGQDPYFPKGCPAQAWSTFALFEIEQMLLKKRFDL